MNLLERIKNIVRRDQSKPEREISSLLVKRAIERISEDESLTADLTDVGAKLLLKFAQGEVIRIVKETKRLDPASTWASIEPNISTLRQNLHNIAHESAQAADPISELKKRLSIPS